MPLDGARGCATFSFQYALKVDEAAGTFVATAESDVDGKIVQYALSGAVHDGPNGRAVYVRPELERRVIAR